MNQEQNNLRPNNFNTQGNNGIPNNQPLNNESFNNTFNQNVVQNPNVNQSTFNQQPINPQPQPQSTPSFQHTINQMNIEQLTPQSLNTTFESGNTSNQNFNINVPNKMNYGLIIGIIIVLIIILTIILLIVFNNKKENSVNNGVINNLTYQKEGVNIHAVGQNYFAVEEGNYTDGLYNTIIDCDGNIVAETLESANWLEYISDDYFIEDYTGNLVSNKQQILKIYGEDYTYKDNIIYYTEKTNDQASIYAYDLINRKSLWDINGYSPMILHNDIIVSKFAEDSKMQILSKYGEVIVKESENEKIYPTSVDRYIKLLDNSFVEVYSLDNTLISSLKLEPSDSFVDVLSIGYFIVKHSTNNTYEYSVYSDESKLIKSFNFDYQLLNYPYSNRYVFSNLGLVSNLFNDDKKSIIISRSSNDSIILLSDGTIIDDLSIVYTHDGAIADWNGILDITKANFATTENKRNECLLISFENSKSLVVEDNICTKLILESPNGKYMIGNIHLQSKFQEKFYVYDNNLNLVYQSDGDNLIVYDDNNVIEFKANDMFLINVFTGKKTKLNLKGKFNTSNSCGIVMSDNNTKYVYKIN